MVGETASLKAPNPLRGRWLRYRMEAAGYSTVEVFAGKVGAARQTVARWLDGDPIRGAGHKEALARTLGVQLGELLGPYILPEPATVREPSAADRAALVRMAHEILAIAGRMGATTPSATDAELEAERQHARLVEQALREAEAKDQPGRRAGGTP